jgi:hypothetical protein
MDLLNDILKVQKLAREDKIQSFQSMFTEEPVAVKAAHAKAQQVQELEDLKVKQEKELESLKDRHERENSKLGLEKEKESENIAIQKKRDATRKANESVELEESKVTCPECDGKGCDHCDDTGYHIKEGKLVTSAVDIIKLITKKVAARLEKEYSSNPEKGLGMINTIGSMVGHKVTDQKQQKGKLFLKFGEELEEGKEEYIMKKGNFTRKVDGKTSDKMKRQGWKLVAKEGIEEGKKIQDIARKHKRELQKIQKSGNLELSKKAEDELYQWASNSGEIHGDEEDEFWDWIDSNLDDLVKGKIKEELEERHADVMRKRNQSQQKAHQKAMMKSAKKSIKDYDAKNKNKNEESEVEEDRDYKKEYESYHKDPEQIKRRAKRNEARRSLKNQKKLTADKDVHHKDNNPMNNDKSNLSIVTQNYNRKEPRMRDKLKEKGCLPNAKRK